LAKDTELQYKSSRWVGPDGQTISKCLVYDPVQVEVLVENPLRKQRVTSLIKVVVYKDRALLPGDKVKEESRILTLPPLSTGTISVSFLPLKESVYHYTVLIEGNQIYTQPRRTPPRLHISKRESVLILDDPSSTVLAGTALTFTGRLLSADTREPIEGAKIRIFNVKHIRRDNPIASVVTGKDGAFSMEKTAKRMHWWDGTFEIYAKFEGDDVYKFSKSNQCAICVAHTPQESGDQPQLAQNA